MHGLVLSRLRRLRAGLFRLFIVVVTLVLFFFIFTFEVLLSFLLGVVGGLALSALLVRELISLLVADVVVAGTRLILIAHRTNLILYP